MPTPSTVFSEIVTTTLRNHPAEVTDNVSANNAFYNFLKRKNRIKLLSGGYEIVRPLDYAENATYQRYSGFDTLNTAQSDVLTAAKYPWVQAAVHITASGAEMRMNSGKEQIIDMAEAKLRNAKRTAANNMSLDIYSNGALANQMGGLASIIQTAGTGTVGGIDSSTWTFWQNKVREAAGTNTISKATIKGEMNLLHLSLVRGIDKPDLIISTHDFYNMYEESLQDLQRYADSDTASAGFNTLKYKTASVIFDSNTNFATTGERMYFLNTEYLEVVAHRAANWNTLPDKVSINQDAVIVPLIWQGQMVCSNRALQGLLIDAA